MSARILIVEDNPVIAREIRVTLEDLSYTVTATVASAEEAFAAIADSVPDLVLMDIRIRGEIDGIDAARMILERVRIPIVYLTSFSDDATLARAGATSAYGYVLKPFTDRDLRTAVEVALHKRELEERLQRETDQLRTTRDLLARDRTLLNATLDHIQDGVVLLDSERRVIFANPAYASMFGLAKDEVDGMTRDHFLARLVTLLEDPEDALMRFERRDPTGDYRFVRPRKRVLRRSEAPVTWPPDGRGILVVWHDITAETELIAERERQLTLDPLTGIANRRGAEDMLKREQARCRRTGLPLSVALFDVDHFKQINDAHGHTVGDQILCEVASTLVAQARLTDCVSRWGGEEFLAVLPGPEKGAIGFCERARIAVKAIRHPRVELVTISAGVAEVGPDELPADAIQRADERLYDAKRLGRDRVVSSRPPRP